MANKRFIAASAAKREVRAEFDIEWEDPEGTKGEATFFCYPARAPGVTMFDITTVGMGSIPMWDLFRSTMQQAPGDPDDNFAKFERFIRDDKHGVGVEQIRAIVDWMMEYDTGNPPEPSTS